MRRLAVVGLLLASAGAMLWWGALPATDEEPPAPPLTASAPRSERATAAPAVPLAPVAAGPRPSRPPVFAPQSLEAATPAAVEVEEQLATGNAEVARSALELALARAFSPDAAVELERAHRLAAAEQQARLVDAGYLAPH